MSQVCVHGGARDAAVSDHLLGVQRCHAGAEYRLREGTSSQRGQAPTSKNKSCFTFLQYNTNAIQNNCVVCWVQKFAFGSSDIFSNHYNYIAANPPGFPGNLPDFETCPGIPDLKFFSWILKFVIKLN